MTIRSKFLIIGESKTAQAAVKKVRDQLELGKEAAQDFNKAFSAGGSFGASFNSKTVRDQAGAVGDLDSSLSTFAGTLDELNLGGASKGLRLGAEILASSEGIQRAGRAINEMGASSAKFIGTAALFSAGVIAMNAILNKGEKQVRKFAEEQRKLSDLAESNVDAISNLSTSQLVEKITDVSQAYAREVEARDRFLKQAAEDILVIEGVTDAVGTSVSGLAQKIGISVGNIGAATSEAEKFNTSIDDLAKELSQLTQISNALQSANQSSINTAVLEQQLETDRIVAEAIRSGSSDQIDARLEQIEIERRLLRDFNAEAEAAFDNFITRNANRLAELEVIASQGGAGAGEAQQELAILKRELDTLGDATENATRQIADLNREEQALRDSVIPVIQANEEAAESADKVARAEDALSDKRKSVASELQKAAADVERTGEKILAFDENLAKQAEQQATRAALSQRQKGEINTARARLEAAKQAAEIIEIRRDTSKREKEIINEAGQENLKARRDLERSIADIEEDFRRDKLRREEELRNDLLGAVIDNDVNRFLELQRGSTLEDTRAISEKDQRIADLREQFEIEKQERHQQVQQNIATIREEAQESIRAQREAGQQRITEIQSIERQITDLQKRHRQEALALEQRFKQEELNIRRQALVAENQDAIRRQQAIVVQGRILGAQALVAGHNVSTNFLRGIQAGVQAAQRPSQNILNFRASIAAHGTGAHEVERIVNRQVNAGFRQFGRMIAIA